ncbi:MAG TPA: hypothetical protein O0X39_00975 [Methanocorpusculum sp.]|nr:hypothetical protein [Methanocorpusculum sp.]
MRKILTLEREKRQVDPKKFMTYISGKTTGDRQYYLLLDEVQKLGALPYI